MSSIISLGSMFNSGKNKSLEDQIVFSNGTFLSLTEEKMHSCMDIAESISS